MTTTSIAHEPLARIVAEAYAADAWHGPNLRTALAGVAEETAFRCPATGRHNIAAIEAGRLESPLAAEERIGLAVGITCHAVYHAGQIQLVKRLLA